MLTLIFIPTYNERGNLERLVTRIRRLALKTDILILDDHSPDGTGELADELAARDSAIHVIHRSRKLGIGSAHLQALHWAYDHGYERFLTMDADFTHQPEDIPLFIGHDSKNDIVIGTRFEDPASLKDWDVLRRMATYLAHFLTIQLLKMPYDASGAFRLYRLDRIPREAFGLVKARGYDFFFESLLVLFMNGFTIYEVPIFLPARACGHSKMAVQDAVRGLWRLFSIFYDLKINRHRYILSGREI